MHHIGSNPSHVIVQHDVVIYEMVSAPTDAAAEDEGRSCGTRLVMWALERARCLSVDWVNMVGMAVGRVGYRHSESMPGWRPTYP